MKKLIQTYRSLAQSFSFSLGILPLRVLMGVAFILHGWPKIQSPMSWMPATAPIPGILQFLAALSEFGGGICVFLGLLIPLASLGLFFTMLVAVSFLMVQGLPFASAGGASWELAGVYLVISVLLFLAGPGRFSLDYVLFKDKK